MNTIFSSITRAFRILFDPQVLGKILSLAMGSFFIWLGVLFFYWTTFVDWIYQPLFHITWIQTLFTMFSQVLSPVVTVTPEQILLLLAKILVLLALAPVVYISTLLLSAFLLVPLLIQSVIKKDFPHFQKRRSGNILINTWITVKATVIYFLILILTWPSFFVPGLQVLIPLLLNAYLAKTILTHEILQELADENEIKFIKSNKSFELFLLGFITAGLFYIPFVNFFAPAITILSYIYFLISTLQKLR
jgi:CysZ protein